MERERCTHAGDVVCDLCNLNDQQLAAMQYYCTGRLEQKRRERAAETKTR
jgi:hypothetical protein